VHFSDYGLKYPFTTENLGRSPKEGRRMAIERAFSLGTDRKILTPEFLSRCKKHIEATGTPLLLDAREKAHTLYAEPSVISDRISYNLRLNQPEDDEFPEMMDWTWEQFFHAKGYDDEDFVEQIMEQFPSDFEDQDWMDEEEKEPEVERRVRAKNLLKESADQDFLWDEYKHWGSPEAQAYYHLFDLDLCPNSKTKEDVGCIRFIDSPSLGYYACSAEVPDSLSLSLLQARLIEIGHETKIEIIGANHE
jgi:hypothetical protein